MESGYEGKGVARALAKGYAQRLFFTSVRQAETFVQKARTGHKKGKPGHGVLNAFDALLGRTLVRRGLLAVPRLKECCEYMKEAAWLPEPVRLRDVLERRGYVPRAKLDEMVAEVVKGIAEANRAYGEIAVRMGFVDETLMQECLAEVDPSTATFRLPRIFEKRGLIDKEKHERIAAELKEEVAAHMLEDHPDADVAGS